MWAGTQIFSPLHRGLSREDKSREKARCYGSDTIFLLPCLSPPPDSENLDLQATQCFVETEGQSMGGESVCRGDTCTRAGAGGQAGSLGRVWKLAPAGQGTASSAGPCSSRLSMRSSPGHGAGVSPPRPSRLPQDPGLSRGSSQAPGIGSSPPLCP